MISQYLGIYQQNKSCHFTNFTLLTKITQPLNFQSNVKILIYIFLQTKITLKVLLIACTSFFIHIGLLMFTFEELNELQRKHLYSHQENHSKEKMHPATCDSNIEKCSHSMKKSKTIFFTSSENSLFLLRYMKKVLKKRFDHDFRSSNKYFLLEENNV